MTTLTASQTRIPPEDFNRVAYQGEVLEIRHRGGRSVFVVSPRDWELLQIARRAHEQVVDEAGDRTIGRFGELLHLLAQ